MVNDKITPELKALADAARAKFDDWFYSWPNRGFMEPREIEDIFESFCAGLTANGATTTPQAKECRFGETGVEATGDQIEAAARAIYENVWFGQDGKPDWVPSGNSIKQDEARSYARSASIPFRAPKLELSDEEIEQIYRRVWEDYGPKARPVAFARAVIAKVLANNAG